MVGSIYAFVPTTALLVHYFINAVRCHEVIVLLKYPQSATAIF